MGGKPLTRKQVHRLVRKAFRDSLPKQPWYRRWFRR